MGWFTKIGDFFGFETVRNRDAKGRFVADDKSTPDVDESKKKVYKSRKPRTGYAKPAKGKTTTAKKKTTKKSTK